MQTTGNRSNLRATKAVVDAYRGDQFHTSSNHSPTGCGTHTFSNDRWIPGVTDQYLGLSEWSFSSRFCRDCQQPMATTCNESVNTHFALNTGCGWLPISLRPKRPFLTLDLNSLAVSELPK